MGKKKKKKKKIIIRFNSFQMNDKVKWKWKLKWIGSLFALLQFLFFNLFILVTDRKKQFYVV